MTKIRLKKKKVQRELTDYYNYICPLHKKRWHRWKWLYSILFWGERKLWNKTSLVILFILSHLNINCQHYLTSCLKVCTRYALTCKKSLITGSRGPRILFKLVVPDQQLAYTIVVCLNQHNLGIWLTISRGKWSYIYEYQPGIVSWLIGKVYNWAHSQFSYF